MLLAVAFSYANSPFNPFKPLRETGYLPLFEERLKLQGYALERKGESWGRETRVYRRAETGDRIDLTLGASPHFDGEDGKLLIVKNGVTQHSDIHNWLRYDGATPSFKGWVKSLMSDLAPSLFS